MRNKYKHKRQATKRRYRQDNSYCEYMLNKADNGGLQKYFRDKFVWDDMCRGWNRNRDKRCWKRYRKTQYRPLTLDFIQDYN